MMKYIYKFVSECSMREQDGCVCVACCVYAYAGHTHEWYRYMGKTTLTQSYKPHRFDIRQKSDRRYIYMYMARGGKAKKEKDTHTHSSISAILVLSYVEQTTHDAMQYTFTILDNTYVRMYYTNQAFNLPFV